MTNWDLEYLGLAFYIGQRLSKDPSTKVGAVISRPDHSIVSLGVNGFPRGCDDSPELFNDRSLKYPRTIHAEQNAMAYATERLHGCSLHVAIPAPFCPVCAGCGAMLIQRGIRRVVYPYIQRCAFADRWYESCVHTQKMFGEVGVEAVPVREDLWRQLPGLSALAFG
jgi:dCMP deaminase